MTELQKQAYKLFQIVNGPGDSGSESEFEASSLATRKGWLRLERHFREQKQKAFTEGRRRHKEEQRLRLLERARQDVQSAQDLRVDAIAGGDNETEWFCELVIDRYQKTIELLEKEKPTQPADEREG